MPPPSPFHRLLARARRLVSRPKPISPLTAAEQDAPLFSRLPPELRCLIWEAYFGARTHAVHVNFERDIRGSGRRVPRVNLEKEKIRSQECSEWFADAAGTTSGPHWTVCGQRWDTPRCGHLSLLLTCKQIYFESISTFYRETLFDFSHCPGSLVALPARLPATHLALISRVNLVWTFRQVLCLGGKEKRDLKRKDFRGQAALWVAIWRALGAMEGLKWLRVELRLADTWEALKWTDIESTLWEGVRMVTARPAHFELVLPFPTAASTRREKLPCTIRRVVDEWALQWSYLYL